jgi:hypothetical protein
VATAVPPVELLDSRRIYWVAAVVAPARGWAGMAGCHKGSRFLLDAGNFGPSRGNYASFDSRAACLEWMMAHRAEIALHAPGAAVRPVSVSRWLLGLD